MNPDIIALAAAVGLTVAVAVLQAFEGDER